MSMLISKRNELVAKLSSLEAVRQAEIDSKVAEYRKIVEAQTSTEQIDKVKNVISALDEVIKYDSANIEVKPVEQVVEPVVQEQVVENVSYAQAAEPRPGMAAVFAPDRN